VTSVARAGHRAAQSSPATL